MKTLTRAVLGAVAIGFVLVGGVVAQDMTGTWVLAVDLDAGTGDATFELVQDGATITGTYTGALGEAEVTGSVDGSSVELKFDSQAGEIVYKGTVEGNSYEGTCEYGQLGSGTFSGTRGG
ncbi:MAG: hypothetical protein OEU54_03235 [Gemmatimonadota bacterium]|nr:hypothetical protein [Gemmatimonadota bacterium]